MTATRIRTMSVVRVPLNDIVANRYRKIAAYRISETKVEALVQSYENSGFWDGSIQARPHPTKAGKFEIAFGHHRIEAARRFKLDDVGLVVAKRTDADMLRMMADENREEFKGDHLVAIETVAATVEAFGNGEIELPPVEPNTPKSHVYLAAGAASYSCSTVARFLGWTQRHGNQEPQPTRACRLAFEAYHERANIVPALQDLPEDDRTRQTTVAVLDAVKSARRATRELPQAERDAAARRAAREAVKQIRQGQVASKVREHATRIGREAARVEPSPVEISRFVRQRADGLRDRVVNLETDVDGLLNVLTLGDTRLRGLFDKWTRRFTDRPVRNVTTTRKSLKA